MRIPSGMHQVVSFLVLPAVICFVAVGADAQPASPTCEISGTWKMVDYQWQGFARPIGGVQNLLFFNETHWVQVSEFSADMADEPTMLSVGGVYAVVGDSLYQMSTLGDPTGERPSATFWCRTDGDRLQLNSRARDELYEYTYERMTPERPENAP